MANQFYSSKNGVNWSGIADSAIGAGVGALVTGGLGTVFGAANNFIGGSISNLFNKKSEKRAMEDLAARMAMEYQYAQRYAENSPSWTVKGLRQAGINPILPFTSGVPSAPSVSGTGINPSHTDSRSETRFDPLTLLNIGILKEQRDGLKLDNDLKSDNLETQKALNEVTRLEAEAKAGLLRPVDTGGIVGDGKSVKVLLPSKAFKALQKGIADDYDLKSERYIRETAEAVAKYGIEVLKLLPFARRSQVMKKIIFDKNQNERAPNSSPPATTSIHGAPRIENGEKVFYYD